MSRTRRRKNDTWEYHWVLRDWVWINEHWLIRTYIDPKSKDGIKLLNKFHSDHDRFEEPGPAWFRNLNTERPQRRKAKRQLQKYILNQEIEVILNSKDPLEYWT